jgi:hypothetical protein
LNASRRTKNIGSVAKNDFSGFLKNTIYFFYSDIFLSFSKKIIFVTELKKATFSILIYLKRKIKIKMLFFLSNM